MSGEVSRTGGVHASVVAIGAFVISAIALLASGVGVMNIMLVSVTERTKEIGVRKSIGAKKRNILVQFLIESSLLAAVGGLLGLLLAAALAWIVRLTTPVPMTITLQADSTSNATFDTWFAAQRAALAEADGGVARGGRPAGLRDRLDLHAAETGLPELVDIRRLPLEAPASQAARRAVLHDARHRRVEEKDPAKVLCWLGQKGTTPAQWTDDRTYLGILRA